MGKVIVILVLCILVALGAVFVSMRKSAESKPSLSISGNELEVEIMKTAEEQMRGLSGRESIEENAGMLFVYEKPITPTFWMKDMNFSIDIIWISEDKKIVDITENLAPETYPATFSPNSPAQYVLEVNAGWAKEYSIAPGDSVEFHDIF